MLDVVSILSRVPYEFVQTLSLPLVQMLALYALIIGVSVLLWRKTKNFAKITDEKSISEES